MMFNIVCALMGRQFVYIASRQSICFGLLIKYRWDTFMYVYPKISLLVVSSILSHTLYVSCIIYIVVLCVWGC